jgi:hypothetical protein
VNLDRWLEAEGADLPFSLNLKKKKNLKSMGHVKAFDNSHKVSPHTRSCFFIAKIGFTKEAHEIPPFVKLGPRGCTNGCRGFWRGIPMQAIDRRSTTIPFSIDILK